MKVVCIDFKEQYYERDIEFGNYVYVSKYNRAVIQGVTQVLYQDGKVKITFRVKSGTKITRNEEFELNEIKVMTTN